MSEQTYSISGLSDLLGKDRRTLKKLLHGIPPVEERHLGKGRMEKRWHMQDVENAIAMDEIGIDPANAWAGCREMLKTFVATELFPKLTSNRAYFGALTGYARKDLRMTKAEALDFVAHVTFCLMSATSAVFDDEAMQFRIDGVLRDWPEANNPAIPMHSFESGGLTRRKHNDEPRRDCPIPFRGVRRQRSRCHRGDDAQGR